MIEGCAMRCAEHASGLEGTPRMGQGRTLRGWCHTRGLGDTDGAVAPALPRSGAQEGRRPVFPKAALSLLQGTHPVVGFRGFSRSACCSSPTGWYGHRSVQVQGARQAERVLQCAKAGSLLLLCDPPERLLVTDLPSLPTALSCSKTFYKKTCL